MDTPLSLEYIAGFADGEGCFTVYYRKSKNGMRESFTPILQITNSNLEVLKKIKETLGAGSIKSEPTPHNLPVYDYTLSSNGLREILPKLIPLLVVKKEQAKLLLEFTQIHKNIGLKYRFRQNPLFQRKCEIYEQLRAINGNRKNALRKEEYDKIDR